MPLMFSKPTVQNRIVFYLRHHVGWISTAELQSQATYWRSTGATIARRSRELADEGKIEVEHRKMAYYRYKA